MKLLETHNISRSFDGQVAVDGVDLQTEAGEVHALVGLNGAGKTTLMRLLLDMVQPDSGVARIHGKDVRASAGEDWANVGYLIETPFSYPELTTAETLRVAALLRGLDTTAVPAAVATAIDDFELSAWADRRARTLSLGNRQRLGLAAATIHQPQVLILDEPANALDPAGVVFIRDLLHERAAAGCAVLISSHHLDELARVAHRITAMHRGSVIGELDPSQPNLERELFEMALEADRARGVAA